MQSTTTGPSPQLTPRQEAGIRAMCQRLRDTGTDADGLPLAHHNRVECRDRALRRFVGMGEAMR